MHLSREQLGEILRKRRIELGLRQKDLVDDILSPSSISNIELGKRKVSEDTIAYYCKKLGWDIKNIASYLDEGEKKEEAQLEILKLKLKSLENDIDYGITKHKLKELKGLKISQKSPYQAVVEYLVGKWYYKADDWEKAKEHFSQAIYIYDKCPEHKSSNIKSTSLYELGRIYYGYNNFDKALDCYKKGLHAFCKEGERSYIKYHLLISKVICLEKKDKIIEAMETLDEMWPHLAVINTETQLNMYEMQAKVYNKLEKYEKAIFYAETGIDIARREKNYNRCFELWTTLGVIYKNMGKLMLAETCFQTASRFENKLRNKYLLPAYNYTELGKLHLQQNKIAMAENILRDAVKLSKRAKDGHQQFESLVALGDCLIQQRKLEEALSFYESAHELAEKLSFTKQEKDIALLLAQYYEKIDSIKHKKYFARFYDLSVQLMHGGEKKMLQNPILYAHLSERQSVGEPPDS
ncbi:tetratricopeptide repeat protein [Laceyella sediminis]|uniref:Tetratricopeptide repeat protein n=1 Tax=Laceyella sediminis TaxID=573074 RepID=A0ABX5ELC4_9BACL|nr:tetratricopeptide repeat protein [Laceyella sediminis]PRZ12677.1 tetratricopeptide repeat protein [Laceyella sediminis]